MSDSQRGFYQPYRPFRRNNRGGRRQYARGNRGYNNNTQGYNSNAQDYNSTSIQGTPENFQYDPSNRGRGHGRGRGGRPPHWEGNYPNRGRGSHWPQQHYWPQQQGVPVNFPVQDNTFPFQGPVDNSQAQHTAPAVQEAHNNSQVQTHLIENPQFPNQPDYTPGLPAELENSQAQSHLTQAPDRKRTSRWDMLSNICSKKKSGKANTTSSSKQKASKGSSQVIARINMSGTEIDEIAGADGEAILWEEKDEVYNEASMGTGADKIPANDNTEQYISSVAELMNLERTERIQIKSHNLNLCEVPTPPRELTKKTFRYEGEQSEVGEAAIQGEYKKFITLEPVLNEAPVVSVTSLAQEFMRSPEKRWYRNSSLQLRTEVPCYTKQLIWARIMLTSEDDKAMLLKSDIFRGVLASLYSIPINSSLLAAFLTFWNTGGHTLLTSQGEMGYPLIAIYDSMGLPISGHLYQEFIPPFAAVSGIVKALHSIYTELWLSHAEGQDQVTVLEWLDYFLGEDLSTTNQAGANMPEDFYADPADPLLTKLDFHVVELQGRRTARFANSEVFYRQKYSAEVHRAAFLVVWLCTYCIPINRGTHIRPEVFSAAASLANGVRLAIGTACMAHLYHCIDNVCQNIITGSRPASECDLPLPAHFIMGWFASYWKITPLQQPLNPEITHFPPFITDSWRITSIGISLHEAHLLFLEQAEDKKSLASLSFLGKSSIRFPTTDTEVSLDDTRGSMGGGRRTIRITAIDMLTSASVGAVTHIRCQFYYNMVYCPHRFARMHGCDQEVPDFLMEGKKGKFLLQFSTYLKGTRDETMEHLQRRHLAYYGLIGHQFYLEPLSWQTKRSFEYVKWCGSTLGFLRKVDNDSFSQEAPLPKTVETIPNSSASNASVTGDIRKSHNIKLVFNRKKTKPGSESSDASDAIPTASSTEEKTGGESAVAPELEISLTIEKKSNTKADTAPKKATGKRSSPAASNKDQSTDFPDPAKESDRSEKSSEINDSHDGSPPKKQCLNVSDDVANLEAVLSHATETKSNIEKIIKIYKDGIGDDFSKLLRHSEPTKLDKYEKRSSIVVPKSQDPWIHMVLGYMRHDFESIKQLIAAPVLDKSALVTTIAKSLERWGMLLQSHDPPQEVSELICELKDLQKNLSADSERVVPINVSTLRSDEEHVQEQLKIGNNSHHSAQLGLGSLEESDAVWSNLVEDVKKKKAQHLSKIKELENALRLARAELSKEQNREASIVSSRTEYNKIKSEASEAVSNFAEFLARGNTCLESIKASIQEAGSQGKSNLSTELSVQLKFIESCQVESAD